MEALERQGLEVIGVDGGTSGLTSALWALRYHARRWWHSPLRQKVDLKLQRTLVSHGYRSDYHWHVGLRERRARRAMAEVRRQGVDVVLHGAANALAAQPTPGVRELLYLDSTWRTQTEHRVPGGPGRYPEALVREGEEADRTSHSRLEHLFVQAEWLAERVAELGVDEERITAVGTGIMTGDMDLGRRPTPGRMLTVVKDMAEERGVTATVEAFSRARVQRPDLQLVLIGNPAYPHRFGHVPGVEAHGYVPRSQLDDEISRASLLVMPAAYQSWGMIYLEALAARTPVLALNRLGIPEITDDGAFGFLVDSQDPGAIAEAMLDAVSDPVRLQKMGEQGRRSVVDRFSWDGVAAKMAAVIADGDQNTGPGR